MRISVKTRPGARGEKVDKIDENHYIVWVKEPAQKGLANIGLTRVLAEYFHKTKAAIKIRSGHTSSAKIIDILD